MFENTSARLPPFWIALKHEVQFWCYSANDLVSEYAVIITKKTFKKNQQTLHLTHLLQYFDKNLYREGSAAKNLKLTTPAGCILAYTQNQISELCDNQSKR